MMRKYFKPSSVTWWSGVALIVMGGALGLDAGYDIGPAADVLRALTGGIGPSVLLAQGAGLIGIRGAL
jgi:hypothetical protein